MVSIIMPCFNHEEFVTEAISSVLKNETDQEIEIIFVDDHSTDNSISKAKEFQLDNIKAIQTPKNSGPSVARNIGIKESRGALIVCLDADDKIPPDYIQKNYENIIDNNIDVSYCDSQCFGAKSDYHCWPEFNADVLRRSPFINCSAMMKKTVWEKVGGFDESMVHGWEDYDFWLKTANKGFKFAKCQSSFLMYRIKEESRDVSAKADHMKEIVTKLRKNNPGFYLG